jgi:hypothetical protein
MTKLRDSVGDRALEVAVVTGPLCNFKSNEPIGSEFSIRLAPIP